VSVVLIFDGDIFASIHAKPHQALSHLTSNDLNPFSESDPQS
jgi:hypothetical protein